MNPTFTLTDEQIDRFADRFADRLAARLTEHAAGELISAAELAERLGRSIDYVRDHADDLGVIRIGDGPRPRLTFPWPLTIESAPTPKSPPSARSRRRAQTTGSPLLPIRGQR